MRTVRVLSIDPGYDRMGVAVLERTSTVNELLFSTCITTDKKTVLPDRLLVIGERIQQLLEEYAPTHVALETLFFNKNIKTAIGVAEARGIILYLARKYNSTICEFGPQEIKVAMTGYGKSDKKAVFDMVKRLIKNAPSSALDDEYDAIAVGVTALAHPLR